MGFYATLDYYWPIIVYGSIVVVIATAMLIVVLNVLRRRGGRLLLLMVVLTVMLAVPAAHLASSIILIHQRNALAAELGIDLWSWPRPAAFPLGYFFSVLEDGMPRQKVHQIAQGYERVLRCGPDSRGFTQEVYYFYSDRDDKALRMQIEYNAQGNLYRVQGEDQNSRVFSVKSCQLGRWDEQ